MPSDGRLREATVRLELLATLHSRNDSHKHITWRYLNPDSSPQLGWDWLVLREDTFKFSKDIYTCDEELVCADFNQAYDSNTTMLSTLGRGRSQLIKKTFNISMQQKFKASCERDYDSIRHRVYGICSDMGTEKGIAEMSTLTPSVACAGNRYKVADTMMYPAAIYMPEFLHIIFNSLQNGTEKLACGKHLVKELKSVQTMMADKSLRRLFVATCVPDPAVAARFKNYSSVEIDWRWETLCDALDHLLPFIDLLRSHFTPSRMMVSDDGKCEAKLSKDVDRILVQQHRLLALAELVRLSGKRLEQTAHRLEGCECHAHVWMARGSHKRKQRNVKASTGTDTCYMKTRQSTWFIVDGLRQSCADLQQCTTTLLQERLSMLPPV